MKLQYLVFILLGICILHKGNAKRTMIPKDLIARVADASSAEDFIRSFLRNKPGCTKGKEGCSDYDVTKASDTGIIAGMISDPGAESGCQPQHKLVPIRPHSDPNVINYPDCVTIPQCGGCCVNDIMICEPVQHSTQTVSVILARYPEPGADWFEFEGTMDVELQHHEECRCQCRVKEQDCHPERQTYVPEDCRCMCINEEEADKCDLNKKWNDDTCSCECKKIPQCYPDEYFDTKRCKCEPLVNAPVHTDPAQDPCLEITCRIGYIKTRTGIDTCACYPPDMDTQQGSLIGGSRREPPAADTATPPPRRRRPRPDNSNSGQMGSIVPRG